MVEMKEEKHYIRVSCHQDFNTAVESTANISLCEDLKTLTISRANNQYVITCQMSTHLDHLSRTSKLRLVIYSFY